MRFDMINIRGFFFMLKKFLCPLFFLALFSFQIDAANFSSLENSAFRVDLDRVTAGYSVSLQGRELISSGYPPSTFALLSVDGKNHDLFQEARIESIKTGPDLLSATLVLDQLKIIQEIRFQKSPSYKESRLLITYRVQNTDSVDHVLGMGLVLDVVPGIENHFIHDPDLEMKLAGIVKPLFFEVPDRYSGRMKLGNYESFKSDFWKHGKTTEKIDNSLSVAMNEQPISANGQFRLSVLLWQQDRKTDVRTDDVDSLLDLPMEGRIQQTAEPALVLPATNILSKTNPVIPLKAVSNQAQTATNQTQSVKKAAGPAKTSPLDDILKPMTNQIKPVKKIENPSPDDPLDGLLEDAAGKTNKGTGK
jgi:hypothetical protein